MSDRSTNHGARTLKSGLPFELRVLYFLVIAAFVVQVGWTISGGMLLRTNATAMCPQVCVGSLVIDRPLAPHSHVHRGETVSIIAPGSRTLDTRRVVHVFANGTFETKANSSSSIDPWTLTSADVKGVTVATVWGLGWLGSALPFLALGVALIVLVRRHIDQNVRRTFDRLFFIVLVGLPLWILNPLIRSRVMSSAPVGAYGYQRLKVLNTGLVPAQFTATQGQFKNFVAPAREVALSGRSQADGHVTFSQFVSFHWWGWVIVLVVILTPIALLVREIAAAQRRAYLEKSRTHVRAAWASSRPRNDTGASLRDERPHSTPRRVDDDVLGSSPVSLLARDQLFTRNDVANNFEHYVEFVPKTKKKKKNKTAKSKSERKRSDTKGE